MSRYTDFVLSLAVPAATARARHVKRAAREALGMGLCRESQRENLARIICEWCPLNGAQEKSGQVNTAQLPQCRSLLHRPAGAGKRATQPSQCRKVHLQDVTKAAECMNAKSIYFAVPDSARLQYKTHQHAVPLTQDDGRTLALKAINTPFPVLQQY